MKYKTKRARATAIPPEVKERVYERDLGRCIFCGAPGLPEAHVISKAHGGLGVEENIVTACRRCHERLDNSTDRKRYIEAADAYLARVYAGRRDASELTYKKGVKE